ncbi:quinone oxidoreductase family protein [Actinomadura atramentaria]|uniref:quinone oxidoreductase family protein n=1 Tax=Actinomadura atramentaria TaxID=1990 RepID=UPI0003A28915|nr:zinc-binding dehydrogenase [Actinomadura atramentaria]
MPPAPATMTALFGGTGPDWEIRRTPVPSPAPGQVLVRVHAAALNNGDLAMLTGDGKEYIAGFEFAGRITALGAGAEGTIDTRVMGTSPASFAEYVLADHRHVIPIPDALDDTEAAALPTGLLTEHGALTLAGFQSGHTVLITGATSAIGLIGIRIARTLGARNILTTTRTSARRDLLIEAGADQVIVTSDDDLTRTVLESTNDEGANIVLDHVGGDTFAACLPATATDGAMVNIGRLGGTTATIDLDTLSYRHVRVRGVSFGFSRPAELGEILTTAATNLSPAIADGRVRAVIDGTWPFNQATQALARLRDGQARGKVVLTLT